ncbi:MAG: PAS domain S-box-containing protein [Porticoccaceae bacterium]|jgi:PAS domain S-box-containing protein
MFSENEQALHSGADHEEILEQVGIAVLTINAKGILLHTNQAAVVMFGYTHAQMLGNNVSMLMPSYRSVQHDGYLEHYLNTGEERIIGKGRRVEGLRAIGSIFPMHLAVGKFENNGEIFFTGIVHDLTAQELVQDEALRFGRIIDKSINEIFVFTSDTLQFTLVNSGALNNLGYTLEELMCLSPFDIKAGYTEESFRTLVAPLLSGELDRLVFQTVHNRKDGTQYDADIVLHLSDAVNPPEFVAIIQDCTERNTLRAAMQQSQNLDSIGQLTGGIAHDFNNLLTVITGNLELLEINTRDTDSLELIEEVRSAAALGANLTSRLLSFARRSAMSPKRLNLNDLVLDMSDLLKRSVGDGISFHTILDPEVCMVKLDHSLLDSALMNLSINARDAMSGVGTLTIQTSNRTVPSSQAAILGIAAGYYAVITTSDTGTGISPDDLQRVFEPFHTTKSMSGGHGLGLSMVYGFARQSGGCLTVESEEGSGAKFTIYLPKDWSSDEEEKPLPTDTGTLSLRKIILLVEDDDSVRRLTERRLRHMGHDVILAINGSEGLTKFRDHPEIDLLITDIVMPGDLNGWQLLSNLRNERTQLPVIVSSGYSGKLADQSDTLEDGVVVLHKPYSFDELKSSIALALATNV